MSQKNIGLKSHTAQSHKVQSHDEKKIRSSQHSKIKKSMADQLRREMHLLIQKKDETGAETMKCYKQYKLWKAQGNQTEAEFYYRLYRTWSDETHRLVEKILVKLKAIQKFEKPKEIEKIEQSLIINTKKQYMKYGPSDEED